MTLTLNLFGQNEQYVFYKDQFKISPLKSIAHNRGIQLNYERQYYKKSSSQITYAYLADLFKGLNIATWENYRGYILAFEQKYFVKEKLNHRTYISADINHLNCKFTDVATFGYKHRDVRNTDSIDVINGLSMGILIGCHTHKLNGLSVSLFKNVVGIQNGVAISAFNRARELHGIQFGLINYAANNRPLFRYMPFVNFNFKKNSTSQLTASCLVLIRAILKLVDTFLLTLSGEEKTTFADPKNHFHKTVILNS